MASPFTLTPVKTPADILTSLSTFNREAPAHPDRARSVLPSTTYWVYHPATGRFGPGKFVGYVGMTFAGYEQGHLGETDGAAFQGGITQKAIRSALDTSFEPHPGLHERLREWGTALLGDGAFGNADPSKWQFVVIGVDDEADNDADEAVEATERSQARRQGFLLDSKLRKALEDHAMDAAKRYFGSLGYDVEDRSGNHPYDLYCRRDQEVLHVEVKGTQTNGTGVVLTAGEVAFARTHKGQMALFVLHSIPVSEGQSGFILGAGERTLILPWDVDLGSLKPVSFVYDLPK